MAYLTSMVGGDVPMACAIVTELDELETLNMVAVLAGGLIGVARAAAKIAGMTPDELTEEVLRGMAIDAARASSGLPPLP